MKLVIVESPAKCETIKRYLGQDYLVEASIGHIRELATTGKGGLGVDIENNFTPNYIISPDKRKVVNDLIRKSNKCEEVILATDPDREGEAIAWHLNRALQDKTSAQIKRIVFNEITPGAITEAVKNPHEIQESKVNAQKARRVLDRLVGYNLSPLLWKKIKNGLSAGRVQSVALRLICEREKEVEEFIPEEYWTLDADFSKGRTVLSSQLVQYEGKKPELKNEASVNEIIEKIKNSECKVIDIKESEKTIRPKAPFTTSKMQQAAANKLGFTSKKTMQVAQQLYEGVNIGSNRVGLITYMRTDSVRISQVALDDVRKFIGENYGQNMMPEKPIEYAVGKKAQDAHEAIRPTYVSYTPDSVKEYLTRDQLRLYSIIWERFVSSQMNNAKSKTVSVDIQAENAIFRISGSKLIEKGFYKAIKLLSSKEDSTGNVPNLKIGEVLKAEKFYPEQHFTSGPARYTDASIVKVLEEKGIGRPSTYAPIISVLLERYYVTRNNKQLVPTALGKMICNILVESFPDIINETFTADMENKLDLVEEDKFILVFSLFIVGSIIGFLHENIFG